MPCLNPRMLSNRVHLSIDMITRSSVFPAKITSSSAYSAYSMSDIDQIVDM